jgi:Bax protein
VKFRSVTTALLMITTIVVITSGMVRSVDVARRSAHVVVPDAAALEVVYQSLSSSVDIAALTGGIAPPVVYTNMVSLAELPSTQRKTKFFEMMLPSVLIAKHQLAELRGEIKRVSALPAPDPEEQAWLEGLISRYRVEDTTRLLHRLQDHPNSIVLAQAAIESGWGSSRFFREGLNAFGVWSYDPNEPRLAAGLAREDSKVYVKKYESILGSVQDYFVTIGRGPYTDFREARTQTRDPMALVAYLVRYSELGDEYVNRVEQVIRSNDLLQYDEYHLEGDEHEATASSM